MLANKKGRYGGNRSTLTYTSSKNSSTLHDRACTCHRGSARATSCVVCLAWLRLRKRLHLMRAMVAA